MTVTITLYAIRLPHDVDGTFYYAGFDREKEVRLVTENPLKAKLYSNMNDIKLRPNEKLVAVTIELSDANVLDISDEFRPVHKRKFSAKEQ